MSLRKHSRRRHAVRRFARITAGLSVALLLSFSCACVKDPEGSKQTSVSMNVTSSTTEAPSQTSSEASATTTELTITTPANSTDETILTSPSGTPSTTAEKLNTANGKFNHVLKIKKWKFDGEMYYYKYKDGTTVYYDKEAKSYFLIDSKGQGWYYDPDLNDFVKDE